ncbi:copper resistance CopC/CopD family protein [Rummeliibacillus sp. JY-2-4R]
MFAIMANKKRYLHKLSILIGFITLCMYILTLFPKEAFAHAFIVNSSPAENEVLSTTPERFYLQFNESIQSGFHSIEILDSSGKKVPLEKTRIDEKNNTILEANINEKLPNGIYTLQWKAVSADGHPIQGVIPFSIGTAQNKASAVKAVTSSYMPEADLLFLRWLLYTSFALYIGGVIFHLFIVKAKQMEDYNVITSKSNRIIWFASLGMFMSLSLNLPLQTRIDAGVSWLEAFNPNLLNITLNQTSFGTIWFVQMLCIVGLLIVVYMGKRRETSYKYWIFSVVFFVALLISKSLTSHAGASQYKILAIPLNFLHLLAASVWVGSLLYIAWLLPISRKVQMDNEKELYWNSIHRFSSIAFIATAVLLLTGIYGSLAYIPTFYSFVHTYYGKALMAKIILFAVMIIFGAFHLIKSKKRGNKLLTRSIYLEFGLGVIVMILAALLTNLPTAISSPGPFKQTLVLDNKNTATLQISPNVAGVNSFRIILKDPFGKPISDVEQAQLTFTNLNANLKENTINISEKSQGVYQSKGMYINMAGKWKVKVHILTKSLDSYDFDFNPVVGSQ